MGNKIWARDFLFFFFFVVNSLMEKFPKDPVHQQRSSPESLMFSSSWWFICTLDEILRYM